MAPYYIKGKLYGSPAILLDVKVGVLADGAWGEPPMYAVVLCNKAIQIVNLYAFIPDNTP